MKKCIKCNRIYNDSLSFCEQCGERLVESNEILDNNTGNEESFVNNNTVNNKKKSNKGCIIALVIGIVLMIVIFIVGLLVFVGLIGVATQEGYNDINENWENIIEDSYNDENSNQYQLDVPFTFDDLEITIGSEYSFSTVDNMYSEYNGQSVVRIPITVKNLSSETHSLNMFYITYYGSQGSQLDGVNYYFDDAIESAGDLRTDASYTKYCYLLYDGDGTYTIELDDWYDKISIDIEVSR